MVHKKQRKAADRKATAAGREGRATMTTEPSFPPTSTDPAAGSASIAPVTPAMMDHAAHEAAARADAVAHDAPEPVPAATDPAAHDLSDGAREAHRDAPHAGPEPLEPASDVEAPPTFAAPATAANENAASASAAVAAAASTTLGAPGLAAIHGRDATERTVESARRAGGGAIDGFGRYNAKILEIAAANMSAAGELMSALLKATSISEAAAINAEHVRRRVDALTTQGRDLMLLAQGVAIDAMRPPGDEP